MCSARSRNSASALSLALSASAASTVDAGPGRGTCAVLSWRAEVMRCRRAGRARRGGAQAARRRPPAARRAATVSAAIWSSASAGSVITTIRSASTDSGAAPIAMWMVGTPWPASQRMRSTPAGVSYQPPSESDVGEARAARVGHLELVGGERRARRRRTRCRRRCGCRARAAAARAPSLSSSAPEPNSAIAQRPPIWRSPSLRIQAIGPSAYS